MAGRAITPFRKVSHCRLIWLIQNVYHCRLLRKTSIDGPKYVTESDRPFPWALKVGQSTDKEKKGITLYIRGVNLAEEILVSFHVYVRKQTSGKPMLDETYRLTFDSQKIWESPLLETNEDFDVELLKEKPCEFWEIRVELMWNEIVEPEIGVKKDSYDTLSKLLCLKELGSHLKQFYKNSRFSDISMKWENKEIPIHKAILEARCPYFMQKINSYSGGDWNETTSLAPTKDKDVMNAFLMYLYTGDIQSFMECGTLPVGIHKCAQRLKKHDLEWLTSPVQLCGYTRVLPKSLGHTWSTGNLYEIFKSDESQTVSCRSKVGDDALSFSLQVKLFKSNHSVNYISVFLELKQMVKESVYVVFEVTVTDDKQMKISKRCSGDMTLKSSIGFPEFMPIDNIVDTQSVLLCTSIHYYDDTLSTQIDKTSLNCELKPQKQSDGTSPRLLLGDGCHGWINLSNDLGQLLMSENCSDCAIVVGDDRFPAHRVILAARSPYFSVVFSRKEDEYMGSSRGMEILVEKDIRISPEMMKIILEEIYTGSSYIKDPQLARDICKFATFFGLKRLEMKCTNYSEATQFDAIAFYGGRKHAFL